MPLLGVCTSFSLLFVSFFGWGGVGARLSLISLVSRTMEV